MFLDPGRDVDEMREARRMAFGKAVAAEAFDLAKAAFGKFRGRSRAPPCRRSISSLNVSMVPTLRNVAMARRKPLASSGVNFAATMASFIACSWNSGTPMVLPST